MRLNKWLASNSRYSRRAADELISSGRVTVNDTTVGLGSQISDTDQVKIDGVLVAVRDQTPIVLLLNKPVGYICSRRGQGAPTVYSLIPPKYHSLDVAGRLDKDSSGLVVMTNSGELAQELTHPKFIKDKVYKIKINKPLTAAHLNELAKGVELVDGISQLQLKSLNPNQLMWQVTMHQGRNRQIRRTFERLGYQVASLHRSQMGAYSLDSIETGQFLLK